MHSAFFDIMQLHTTSLNGHVLEKRQNVIWHFIIMTFIIRVYIYRLYIYIYTYNIIFMQQWTIERHAAVQVHARYCTITATSFQRQWTVKVHWRHWCIIEHDFKFYTFLSLRFFLEISRPDTFRNAARRWREGCSKHAACSPATDLNMEWVGKNFDMFHHSLVTRTRQGLQHLRPSVWSLDLMRVCWRAVVVSLYSMRWDTSWWIRQLHVAG